MEVNATREAAIGSIRDAILLLDQERNIYVARQYFSLLKSLMKLYASAIS